MYFQSNTPSLRGSEPAGIATITSQRFSPIRTCPLRALLILHETYLLTGASNDVIHLEITDLYDEDYVLKRPIPVALNAAEDGEFVASIEGANIAMSGTFASEAIRLLREHLIALYAILLSERLGPEPRRQREFLETYIGEKGR